jgi:ABC-2 type transport system ATP-binding protein
VKYTGTMRGLIANTDGVSATYQLTLANAHVATSEALGRLPGMQKVTPPADNGGRYLVTFDRNQLTLNAILQAALTAGGEIVSFSEDVKHLNQAFMDLTEPGVGG